MTMTKTYTGGCACGAIRYETSSEPIFENHCQCRDCQKRSGTGHGSYLTFPQRADVTITGEANTWRVAGDSGNEKVHAFCPTCGTPVHLAFVAIPEQIAPQAHRSEKTAERRALRYVVVDHEDDSFRCACGVV